MPGPAHAPVNVAIPGLRLTAVRQIDPGFVIVKSRKNRTPSMALLKNRIFRRCPASLGQYR